MPYDTPDKPTDETGMEPRGQRATGRIIPACVYCLKDIDTTAMRYYDTLGRPVHPDCRDAAVAEIASLARKAMNEIL
jgi:hypothetical protein